MSKRITIAIVLPIAFLAMVTAVMAGYPRVETSNYGSVGRPFAFTFRDIPLPATGVFDWGDYSTSVITLTTNPQVEYHVYTATGTYMAMGLFNTPSGTLDVGNVFGIKCNLPVINLPVYRARPNVPFVLEAVQPSTVSLPYTITWFVESDIYTGEIVTATVSHCGEVNVVAVGQVGCSEEVVIEVTVAIIREQLLFLPLVQWRN